MKDLLAKSKLNHVCLVTDDLERSKSIMAGLLGVETPETVVIPGSNITFKGKPAPELGCQQMAFSFGEFAVEMIMPNEAESTWREHLRTKGKGLHHLCFHVNNLEAVLGPFEEYGMPVVQTGEFEGGRYAYVDATEQIGMYLELLELD